MSVTFTRTGIPLPGKQMEALNYMKARAAAMQAVYGVQNEVKIRAGGPVGQVILISHLKDLTEFEMIKRKVVADTATGKIPTAPDHVFASGEDMLWMSV